MSLINTKLKSQAGVLQIEVHIQHPSWKAFHSRMYEHRITLHKKKTRSNELPHTFQKWKKTSQTTSDKIYQGSRKEVDFLKEYVPYQHTLSSQMVCDVRLIMPISFHLTINKTFHQLQCLTGSQYTHFLSPSPSLLAHQYQSSPLPPPIPSNQNRLLSLPPGPALIPSAFK